MKSIVFYFLTFIIGNTFAQTFDLLISNPQTIHSGFTIELKNNNILVFDYKTTNSSSITNILLLNESGNNLNKTSTEFYIYDAIQINDTAFLCFGNKNSTDSVKSILITQIRSINTLNILVESSLETRSDYGGAGNLVFDDTMAFFDVSIFKDTTFSLCVEHIVGEITNLGKITNINSTFLITQPTQGLLKRENLLFSFMPLNKIRTYDLNLNLIKVGGFSDSDLVYDYDSFVYHHDTIISAGRYFNDLGENGFDFLILQTDTNFNEIKRQQISSNYLKNYAGYYNCLAPIKDGFFFVGTRNVTFNNYPFVHDTSSIYLAKCNNNLEIIWEKEFGGDANYYVWDIIPSEDGGCIIASSRYNMEENDNNVDLYLLKVDSLGNYQPNNIKETIATQKVSVYPNPGSNYVTIALENLQANSIFQLYSYTGKVLLQQTITTNKATINTSLLNTGLYFYKITAGDTVIKTGKWVKQ